MLSELLEKRGYSISSIRLTMHRKLIPTGSISLDFALVEAESFHGRSESCVVYPARLRVDLMQWDSIGAPTLHFSDLRLVICQSPSAVVPVFLWDRADYEGGSLTLTGDPLPAELYPDGVSFLDILLLPSPSVVAGK